MKSFDYYEKVDVVYPSRFDYVTNYWYKNGKLIAKQRPREAIEYQADAPRPPLGDCVTEKSFDVENYTKQVKAASESCGRKIAEFRSDLFKELGIEENPKRELLFSIAWDRGHSYGYEEIFNMAVDLAELIK